MTRNALGETESKLLSESSRAILLAGDNRALSAWLVRLLRKDHYVIDCAYDGEEADVALCTHQYALVILDLGLPGLDGSRVKGLDSGADDYLVKPLTFPNLRHEFGRSCGAAKP
jgi:two-component system, OmpR family, response regulator TctD